MPEQIARTVKQLGAILRRARTQAAHSQSSLGELIHMRQATISRLEDGAPAVQLQTFMEVLAALNLELVVRTRTRGDATDFETLF